MLDNIYTVFSVLFPGWEFHPAVHENSDAGMNLKVGGTRPAQSAEKKFLCPSTFFGSTSTISRFGERFRDGQYSLVSFLFCCFSTHGAPPVPSHL